MTPYIRYSYKELERFCNDCFEKFGFTENESKIISDVLLLSDLYGIESHGMQRLARYHKGIEKGLIKVGAKPEIVHETPVSAVIEGNDGMGQLIAHKAMTLAIEKAKTTGMAIVTVRNSNHFGIAGYYAKMACDAGLLGMAMTNSEAIMVPTFGRLAMLGSNPIAIAMPADPYDFFFDASTTVVTRGKLEIYNKLGKPLPEGWALDKDGKGSSDAKDVLANIVAKKGGGIMPLGGETEQLGGHKGYGYGMLCEIFCSILSMGITSNHTHTNGKGGTCHGFMAVDPKIFGDADAIKEHLSTFLCELRESPKAEGATRIYTHGEKEIIAKADRMENGIDVNINTVAEMFEMCKYVGLNPVDYLGDVRFEDAKASSYK
ncbi:MAG: Ldh family oxidoreductase [Clostridia bacterium]|nr:Ldh family oxidoreductase [Clostridia bacterium]MBR4033323.1 Ldh family oxidoreductase [Clostridia bacterium]